ncbi:hypothetical protein [Methylobacterium nigriterrae]|uniref:hypothetical protein n=1 Tax=Methylobacterium nigriterrae TaxID=3127512 RepID=UPI003013977B
MTDLPPWREVEPADFLRATDKETLALQKALLKARDEGLFRLRLVLREAKDLKPCAYRDPLWLHDYKFGPHHIVTGADEVVIETRDGQRHEAKQARGSERGLTQSTQSVLWALTDEFTAPSAIAARAGLVSRYRNEEAARLCEYLVRIGLAECRKDSRRRWRRASTGRHDPSSP